MVDRVSAKLSGVDRLVAKMENIDRLESRLDKFQDMLKESKEQVGWPYLSSKTLNDIA